MMLTFSRTAAGEFRNRLHQLIGVLAFDIEISTFHAYALKLIARVVKDNDNDFLQEAIIEATKQIQNGDIILPYKSVLVLDEFQDITKESFGLVRAIYHANDKDMRVIAVGDDDQCIYGYAGADIRFIDQFKEEFGKDEEENHLHKEYELLTNFRSTQSIVNYTNRFIERLADRHKKHPLEPFSKEYGSVTVTTCHSENLITPAVNLTKSICEAQKTIAILAHTNDEVMQIYSQLSQMGITARFIIDRDKFQLKNVAEIVAFGLALNKMVKYTPLNSEEMFANALKIVESKYKDSKNLNLLRKVIDRFLIESVEYYLSEWFTYLDEIELEDFDKNDQSVTVSTIHKSKGLEFDKVIVLVNKTPKSPTEKRLFYVGMTRAKEDLTIIRHGDNSFKKKADATYHYDTNSYPNEQKVITYIMGLGDIYLGYKGYQHYHDMALIAGSSVRFEKKEKHNPHYITSANKTIGCLSKAYDQKLTQYLMGGYKIKSATIDFVVHWQNKDKETLAHPLCKIVLGREG